MTFWEGVVQELRIEFVRGSHERLQRIARSIDELERNSGNAVALKELLLHFHAFAGLGTTYRFPDVTAMGLQGELKCQELINTHEPPEPDDLSRWRTLIDDIRADLARVSTAPEPAPPGPFVTELSRPPEILIVDDDVDTRAFLARLLQQKKLRPREAGTKAEAFRALDDKMADGAIVNIRLPDGPGYEVVERLRGLPGGEAAAVLVMSGPTGFLDKVEAIRCGADGYFDKPVNWEALMHRLHHLLKRGQVDPPRILSVEDDPDQAAYIRAILESAGYTVRVCHDPRGFEAELAAFEPDLILMDVVLPGFSGHDLARFVRQDERHATLPILFLTTHGQLHTRIEGMRAGGDDHLLKPIAPALLLSTVAARVERARFLKSLLYLDGLTRLLTHTAFMERAQSALARMGRGRQRSAVLVRADLDHFKMINERHGHVAGDRVLVALASLLRRRLRQTDVIGRYGGDELSVIVDDLGEEEAVRLVVRLLEEFSAMKHEAPDGTPFSATFSAGVALVASSRGSLEGWQRAAEDALAAAKRAGRSRVVAASVATG